MYLRIGRMVKVKVFYEVEKDIFYFRVRDIADYLGISLAYEITRGARRDIGIRSIVQGSKTKSFRGGEDNGKTAFISANNLKKYLINFKGNHNMIEDKYYDLLREIEDYVIIPKY